MTGTITGPLKLFYPNGQLKEDAYRINDKLESPFVHYWPAGKLKAKGRFKHNKLDVWIQRFDSITGKVDSVLF